MKNVLKQMYLRSSITLAVGIILALFYLPGIAFAGPGLSLNPLTGASGAQVTVSGSGFGANQSGWVWFDTDGDGTRGTGEPQSNVVADGSGVFTTTLTAPSVAPGYYLIRADLPEGGSVEAETFFIVNRPSLTLGLTKGPAGTAVIATGRNFAPGNTGWVWFDINGNQAKDIGEPAMRVTADSSGGFYASVVVPNVATGAYFIRADLPEGGYSEEEAVFTVTPIINVRPASGSPGTLITVTGNGFEAGQTGQVWFDTNRNGMNDSSETAVNVISNSYGKVTAILTVPNTGLNLGAYPVRIDFPTGGLVEATVNFAVKGPSLTLSPTKAIPGGSITISGSRYPANTPGWVWFDTNGNSVRDTGELFKKVTTTRYGSFVSSLVVPNVPAAVYSVRVDLPSGNAVDGGATMVVMPEPTISLSHTNGTPGAVVVITGTNFKAWTSGRVWFDVDGDGKKDGNEVFKSAKTNGFGKFRATLTVPRQVRPGAYAIYADIPAWGKPEAWADFFVTGPSPSDDLSGGNLDVVMNTPSDGAMGTHRYPTLKVVFNTRFIKGPDFGSINLSDEDGNDVRIKVSTYGKALKVRPTGILKAWKTYVLFIPARAVIDVKGAGLDDDFILTFTTRK